MLVYILTYKVIYTFIHVVKDLKFNHPPIPSLLPILWSLRLLFCNLSSIYPFWNSLTMGQGRVATTHQVQLNFLDLNLSVLMRKTWNQWSKHFVPFYHCEHESWGSSTAFFLYSLTYTFMNLFTFQDWASFHEGGGSNLDNRDLRMVLEDPRPDDEGLGTWWWRNVGTFGKKLVIIDVKNEVNSLWNRCHKRIRDEGTRRTFTYQDTYLCSDNRPEKRTQKNEYGPTLQSTPSTRIPDGGPQPHMCPDRSPVSRGFLRSRLPGFPSFTLYAHLELWKKV